MNNKKFLLIYGIIIIILLLGIMFFIPDDFFKKQYDDIDIPTTEKKDFISYETQIENLLNKQYEYEYLILDSIGTKSYTYECSGKMDDTIESGTCTKPKKVSYTEQNKKDVYNMGEQALELAKPYFNPKTTYVSEGLVLDSSELERFDTSYRGLGLLKFKTEYNPDGLNPEKGNFIESGTGIDMYNAILVSDVHEIDFKDKNGEYVGFQFIIVLNENVSYLAAQTNEDGTVIKDETGKVVLEENRRTAKISTDQLYNYGSIEAGQRLVNYLRNNHPEVGNLPIQVLLYKTTSSDSMLNGTFIGQSYVTNRASTTYETINQEWVFAPSSRLNALDSVLAGQIQSVKSKLFENWPNEVGFYGKVFFEDNMASEIELEINMRGKTYVEIQSLIQYLVQLIPSISNDNAKLSVHVLSDGNTHWNPCVKDCEGQKFNETAHNYNQQTQSSQYLENEADCDSKATYYYHCECGYKGTETYEFGEVLGHNYVKGNTINPSCEEVGYTIYTCSRCADVEHRDEVAALGHAGGTATCQELAKCSTCGKSYGELAAHNFATTLSFNETSHWYACKTQGCSEKDSLTDHECDSVVTKPTCTENGYTTHSCECGYSYEDVIIMTKKYPQLYSLSIENIREKIVFYDFIGISDLIVSRTKLLIQSVELSYARYMLLCEQGIVINMDNYTILFYGQKNFEKMFMRGISKVELMKVYNYKNNKQKDTLCRRKGGNI